MLSSSAAGGLVTVHILNDMFIHACRCKNALGRAPPRRTRALHTACAPLRATPVSRTSILPVVLVPALTILKMLTRVVVVVVVVVVDPARSRRGVPQTTGDQLGNLARGTLVCELLACKLAVEAVVTNGIGTLPTPNRTPDNQPA